MERSALWQRTSVAVVADEMGGVDGAVALDAVASGWLAVLRWSAIASTPISTRASAAIATTRLRCVADTSRGYPRPH